jgi:cytoskeletal protein RodZ
MQTNISSLLPSVAERHSHWGSMLREARLSRQLTEEQIATKLKLSVAQIMAIEAEDIAAVHSSAVFVKGYVNNYAQLVGVTIPPNELSKLLSPESLLSVNQVQENLTQNVKKTRKGFWWIFILLLLVVLGWQFGTDAQLTVLVNQ